MWSSGFLKGCRILRLGALGFRSLDAHFGRECSGFVEDSGLKLLRWGVPSLSRNDDFDKAASRNEAVALRASTVPVSHICTYEYEQLAIQAVATLRMTDARPCKNCHLMPDISGHPAPCILKVSIGTSTDKKLDWEWRGARFNRAWGAHGRNDLRLDLQLPTPFTFSPKAP